MVGFDMNLEADYCRFDYWRESLGEVDWADPEAAVVVVAAAVVAKVFVQPLRAISQYQKVVAR